MTFNPFSNMPDQDMPAYVELTVIIDIEMTPQLWACLKSGGYSGELSIPNKNGQTWSLHEIEGLLGATVRPFQAVEDEDDAE